MTERIVNFSAGPGILPLPVLHQAQADLVSLPGVGASALEVSHRGAWFTGVIEEAEANLRALLRIPSSHRVLFIQGGATMQFSMVAMNLLRAVRQADYIVTGAWGAKAAAEAARVGPTRLAWSGTDEGYTRVPAAEELLGAIDAGASYVHITTNETIQGVEYPDTPIVPDAVPLVADGSSDFLARPVDIDRYAVLYAGAQKNAGPAGVTVAIVREDVLAGVSDDVPTMLDYRTYADRGSLYNTPPVFSIYVVMLVTRWLRDEIGGLAAMLEHNRAKAALLYDLLDAFPEIYRGHAERGSRSLMTLTFRLPSEDLERRFVAEAAEAGMVDLKGHRSLGGIRASIYNAMPLSGVERLAEFMRAFVATAG